MRFTWDPRKAKANLRKHGVSFNEAMDAFQNPYAKLWVDPEHSGSEDRYQLLAQSQLRQVLLLVIHCYPSNDAVRIFSARQASKSERKQYYED
ncbi:BrnT family toxin [Pseudoduganella sp. FT26W]|uniref:BrnT family toxin n=1 Tax=Duganella aquatilis TaxID=2666082 RepID=A0A844DFI6_9BURK|nr:BrnT family toxin [Duganella aquatilis]